MNEEVVDQSQEEVIVNEPQATEEVQADEVSENPAESDAEVIDDSEEIEYEGEKYKVPKNLKEAFLRHQDYTRKTQEVAEQRRAFEQQQAQEKEHIQRQRQHIQDYAQIHALDMQIKQFEGVDWQKIIEADPVEAMKLDRQYRTLAEMRQGIATRIQQVEAQEAFSQQQHVAKLIEEGREVLKREIPNWSEQTQKSVSEYAISFGFKPEEVAQVIDPRHVKVLHKAGRLAATVVRPQPRKASSAPPPIQPVGARATPVTDPDKMSADEWLKWRNSQLKKR